MLIALKWGSSGSIRIKSMFPLGESDDIRMDPDTGAPVFDSNFFSMTDLFDTFAYRSFPKFTSSHHDDDDLCFINAIRMK